MKTRAKSPATVVTVIIALLVIASVAIWMQIASHLGINLLGGQPSDSGNNIAPATSEEEEPSRFPPDVTETEIEEPNLEDDSGASEPAASDLEQYPGFRFINSDLDERAFAYEELAREYLTANCMEEQGWQYYPTTTVQNAGSQVGIDKNFMNLNEKFVASLTQSESTSYNLALTGVEDPNDPVTGYAPGLGCMNESFQEIPGVYALASEFMEELTDLEEKARAEVASGADQQDQYRLALIAKQNEFAAKHKTELSEFQKTHAKESARVVQIITRWAQTV